jgi:hypothetical protein
VFASGPDASKEKRFRTISQYIMLSIASLIVLFGAITATWLPFYGSEEMPVFVVSAMVIVELIFAVVVIAVFIRMGQGGHRLEIGTEAVSATQPPDTTEILGDGTPDHKWLIGMIYANADDPAVWVETRYGVGWTLNFARLASWLLLVLLLLPGVLGVGVAIWASQQATVPQAATRPAIADFVNDPDLIGTWISVDFVREPDHFVPGERQSQGDLYLTSLDIAENGRIRNTGLVWTKGQISHGPNDPRPALYEIKQLDDQQYLFMEWISGDVTIRKQKPWYYVLRKRVPGDPAAQAHCKPAQTSQPVIDFVNDPDLIGTWISVDFVREIADFNPEKKRWQGDLFLKQVIVRENGIVENLDYQWTRGRFIRGSEFERPALYEIKKLGGQQYLFMEWISGDVTIRKMKPQYYVLKKEKP